MFDRILNQLKETRDRQAVMILLQGLDVPMAVLTIKSDLATGELWIENGKYIVYAKVLPNGDGGLMDMLRVLAISDAEFTLEKRDDKPPPCQVIIHLSEVVADEHAVARKIKNVLWPVEDAEPAEAKPAAKRGKRSKKKTVEELEITRVRGAATDEAIEAYVEKQNTADQAPEAKPADKPAEDKPQDKPVAEKSADEPAGGLKPDVAEAIGDRLDELFSDKDHAAKPAEPVAVTQPELSIENWEKVEQILADKPTVNADGKGSASLSSLFDDEESEAEEAPAAAAAAASAPAAAGVKQTVTAFELNAQMISAAAKEADTPQPAVASVAPAASAAASGAATTPADAAAFKKAMKNTWEGLSAKQQAHYVAMSALLGEEPEQFYAEAEAHAQMTEESLDEQRKEEAAALAQALAEDPQAFQVGKPKIVDPAKTNDELKSRRQADYEALKLFYAEEPAKFEEKVGLDQKLDDNGLTDFQKRILEISNEEGRTRDEFDQVDEKLTAGPDIRPAWDPTEIPSAEPLNAIATPGERSSGDDLEYVAQKVDSPYAESAPEISLTTSLRKKLSLEAEEQSTDLITRIARATHLVPAGAEGEIARPSMTRFIVAGLAGTLLIPLSVFVIWHYYDSQAQEDMAMQREAARMAERSLVQKSMVTKPQEPFRMPAAPPQSPLPGGESAQAAAASDQSISAAQKSAACGYTWHQPKDGNGPTPDQVAAASQEMQNADSFMSAGNKDRALALYTQAIHKYPSNALLRAKAARLCISLGQYKQAYMICFTGLDACQTRADFDMLVSIIKEIP